jgi:hypothetical protein
VPVVLASWSRSSQESPRMPARKPTWQPQGTFMTSPESVSSRKPLTSYF